MSEETVLEKVINWIFDIKKNTWILILIFLLGLVLRLIAAINLGVTADDMVFVNHAIDFISSDKLVVYHQSSGLWFAFTSIMYNIFETTQLASRMAALIFGSLSILVIYLLTREFFNKKIAMIAALFLAVAPFHIKNTYAEMDVMAMFFVLLGMFLFIKATKSDQKSYFVLSGIFIGVAIYTKVYPLLFIPSLLLYFALFKVKSKKRVITKNNIKRIVLFILVIFIFTIPTLTHNYLLYKDKGFLDLQFTRTLNLGRDVSEQYYSWDHQFNAKNDWAGLITGAPEVYGNNIPKLWIAMNYVRTGDPIVFYLGTLGLIISLIYRKWRDYSEFFILSILFALPFLASIILLNKHYIFIEMLLIPLAALSTNEIIRKASKVLKKNTFKIVIVVILLSSLALIGSPSTGLTHVYGKNHIGKMIDFKEENIQESSLIVIDSRMYRGRINWVFHGRPYLEGSQFIQLLNQQEQIEGNLVSINVYFFECVYDDCGWGTINDQPEFNESMESLTKMFKQNGNLVKTLKEPNQKENYLPLVSGSRSEAVRIYSANLQLKESIIQIATQPKNWFLYDIGYEPKEKQFDYYKTDGFFDIFLDKLAHWIVLLSLTIVFLSPIYVIYLVHGRNKKDSFGDSSSIQ